MRGVKGFSLFEVSSVILLVLTLSAITVPGMYSVYNSYKLTSTTQAISATLQSARVRAVRENRTVSVIFNASSRQFGIDEDGNGRLEPKEAFLIPNGVSFGPYITISFMPDGLLPEGMSALAVTVTNGSETRSINVLPNGELKLS